jgi:hypothetical protein
MPNAPWTWAVRAHPDIAKVFYTPAADLEWCGRLETAATDATIGKVLCVCAAAAVAREVLAARGEAAQDAVEALKLLDRWIDDPTEQRFQHICSLIVRGG